MAGVIATAAVQIRARDSRGRFRSDVNQMVDKATAGVGEKAGDRLGAGMGKSAQKGFLAEFRKGLTQKTRGISLPISAAVALSPSLLPILASATTAAAGMAAAFATAGIGVAAFGVAAVPILTELFEATKKVTEQQTKFDTAAKDTATTLARSTDLAEAHADLLAELDPTLRSVVDLLGEEGTKWRDLSAAQQVALVQLRQDKELYKQLLPAQKNAVNALLDQRDAWLALSPAQRQAALATDGLKARFAAFKEQLEPRVLGLYAQGVRTAGSALKPLAPLAEAAGDGLGVVMDNIERATNSQRFADQIQELAQNTGPAIIATAKGLTNIGSGLIGIFNAFAGNQGVLTSMVDATERFAEFGQGLGESERFQSFLAYVEETGPVVRQTLDSMGDALGTVLSAVAPLGAPTLQFVQSLSALVSTIASLPGGLGTAAVALALYGPLAAKVTSGLVGLTLAFNRVSKSAGNAVAGIGGATGTASRASSAWGTLGRAVTGVGTALPIVGIGVGLIAAALARNEQRVAASTAAYERLFTEAQQGGEQGAAAARQIEGLTLAFRNIDRGGNPIGDLAESFDKAKASADRARESMSTLDLLQQEVTRTQNDLTAAIDRYGEDTPQATTAASAYRFAQQNLKTVQDQLALSTQTATERINEQTDAVQAGASADLAYEQSTLSATQAIDSYTQAVASGTLTTNQLSQAEIAAKQALLQQGQAALTAALQTDAAADKNAVLRGEYTKLRDQLAPGSSLRQFLDGLIRDLDVAARDRTSTLHIRTVNHHPTGRGRAVPTFATGGPFGPGIALVGEQGPEIVEFEGRGRVHTARETKDILANGGQSAAPALGATAPAASVPTAEQIQAAVAAGVLQAIDRARVQVDPVGLARVVATGALRMPGRR